MPTAREPRPQRQALAALGAAAVFGLALAWPTADDDASKSLELPALPAFSTPCSESTDLAARRATELERRGIARIARYPFAPSEALQALNDLAEAESCAKLAHTTDTITRVARRATAFRARVERDYRAHALRYDHARRAERLSTVAVDIDFLLALLAQHESSLVRMLRRDRRSFERSTQGAAS